MLGLWSVKTHLPACPAPRPLRRPRPPRSPAAPPGRLAPRDQLEAVLFLEHVLAELDRQQRQLRIDLLELLLLLRRQIRPAADESL